MNKYIIIVLTLTFFSTSSADIAVTTNARKSLKIALYRDFGIVNDERSVNVLQGSNSIRFEDVAAEIDETSIEFKWACESPLEVLGQTYEFDLMSPVKLLEKYIGKELEIIPLSNTVQDPTPQKAELISIHGEQPVFRIGTQITFGQIGRILFPYVPENLFTKPTLIWDVVSKDRQDINLTAQYATKGLSWNAGYTFKVDTKNETGTFKGWIQLDNHSGMSCKDAHITCVAGNPHRIQPPGHPDPAMYKSLDMLSGNFYFYTINRPVTLLDNQKKQVEWIPEVAINYHPGYLVELYDTTNGSPSVVYMVAHIDNTRDNNLGLPLPSGVARISKYDNLNNDWFVGEDQLEDSKDNSQFCLKIKPISDIIVTKRKIVEQGNNNNFIIDIVSKSDSVVGITIRNYSNLTSSIISNDKFVSNGNYAEWFVRVHPGQKSKIRYTIQKKG